MTRQGTEIAGRNGAGIREQLDATTRALAEAHEADVQGAIAGVRWERRGLLQRLVRRPRG